MNYQFDRDYSLYIGWKDEQKNHGVLVKDLQCEFSINKIFDTRLKPGTSTIKVYNLNVEQTRALQEKEVTVRLLVGYRGALKELCLGQVLDVSTKKEGVDRITEFVVGEGHSLLNNTHVVGTIPAGKTIRDVITAVATQAGLVLGKFTGNRINTTTLWGYPLEGTVKQQLDEICASYSLSYNINGGVLSVSDRDGTDSETKTAVVFNQSNGLLSIPFVEAWNEGRKKKDRKRVKGISFVALINGNVKPGSIIKMDRPKEQEGEVPNGWYYVVEVDYKGNFRGTDWTMTVKCERIDEE